MMEITKEEFMKFKEGIEVHGRNVSALMSYTDLSFDHIQYMMKHYERLERKFLNGDKSPPRITNIVLEHSVTRKTPQGHFVKFGSTVTIDLDGSTHEDLPEAALIQSDEFDKLIDTAFVKYESWEEQEAERIVKKAEEKARLLTEKMTEDLKP